MPTRKMKTAVLMQIFLKRNKIWCVKKIPHLGDFLFLYIKVLNRTAKSFTIIVSMGVPLTGCENPCDTRHNMDAPRGVFFVL